MSEVGSELLRRHIGRRLLAAREAAGLTQDAAAKSIDKGRTTLMRWEDGDERVRFRDIDVRALLAVYGVPDDEQEFLLALTAETRNGRRKSWWHDYTDSALPEFLRLYLMLEDSSEVIRQYEVELVPGLLQTRAYAEAVHRVPAGYVDEDEVQRRVNVRMARQSLLTRPRAPHLNVIVSETILHRLVGGPAVMAEQLAHLVAVSRQANISIRVLPFAVGVHGGMAASAPFTLLSFPRDARGELLEPPLAYVDTLTGALYLNKPDEFEAYQLAWKDLDHRTPNEEESRRMITSVLEELRAG